MLSSTCIRHRHFVDWRFGVISCLASVTTVFAVNLIFIASLAPSIAFSHGIGVLFEGSCTKTGNLNTGAHFFINVLSTMLLSSSSYCMQCLSAPTRKEIDAAHECGIWLEIGVPSIKNLRNISKKRTFAWAMLGLSSAFLHLLY